MRYTIHYKWGVDYLPLINCQDINSVGTKISNDTEYEDHAFKVYDNQKKDWLPPETVLLACVFHQNVANPV